MNPITYYLVSSLAVIVITYIIRFLWKSRRWYMAAQQYTGPTAYPLIGNAHLFMCKHEDILMRMDKVVKLYLDIPFRFWLGPWLVIVIANPDHLEKILPSSKFSTKHEIYRFVKIFLGNGLITGSGPMYRKHRRIIQPIFDLNFSKETTSFMQKHMILCMERLEPYMDKGNFDFFHVIHPCMADIIKEIILGCDEKSQINGTNEFDQAMLELWKWTVWSSINNRNPFSLDFGPGGRGRIESLQELAIARIEKSAYEFAYTRMVKLWQHVDFLFDMTPLKKQQDRLVKTIRSKAGEMIDAAFKRRKLLQATDFHPVIDRIVDYIEEDPGVIDRETFIEHVITLYAASEDTLSLVSAFLAMSFGMCPDIQEKAAKEVRDVFGETPRPVTTDDIPKLHYITMCIKEVLRLFPVGPLILRKCAANFELDKWMIPRGCAIAIPIYNLHRDPRSWEKPNEFYPEHFLPEAENKRHVYSYIPFSAGPRGCIGKLLANTGLKIFICNLLQRYEIECDGAIQDLKIKADISTRPTNGSYLRLKKRVWN